MLPEYGICMSLVRSTSAALAICDVCSGNVSIRNKTGSEEMSARDKDVNRDGDRCQPAFRKPLTVSYVVDILCYGCYLPLFFAGPLMTFENFYQQVCFF